jgi:hypothetical protein
MYECIDIMERPTLEPTQWQPNLLMQSCYPNFIPTTCDSKSNQAPPPTHSVSAPQTLHLHAVSAARRRYGMEAVLAAIAGGVGRGCAMPDNGVIC